MLAGILKIDNHLIIVIIIVIIILIIIVIIVVIMINDAYPGDRRKSCPAWPLA